MTGYRWDMFGCLLKALGAASLVFVLAACGGGRVEAWGKAVGERDSALRPGSDLLGVTVPVLRSHGLERVWGAPTIKRDGEGGYLLTYTDPRSSASRLMIRGMAAPLPKLSSPPPLAGKVENNTITAGPTKQEWREVSILGEAVRWFRASAGTSPDAASFSTEGFALKSPDGRKGYFRLAARSGSGRAEDVARWFGSVSF